jgi:beta-glucosidase
VSEESGPRKFPADFIWGAATAAYQVEGATRDDGRGESIWDRFAHTPGRIRDGSTGDVACDSYHRFLEDVKLLQQLNLRSYRFSISWTRLQPTGRGAVNPRGADYYRRLVDALLAAGIRPLVTLYHWDLPQALEDAGGWPERDTAQRFADFAALAVRALGDQVNHWLLFNEPKAFTTLGYWAGKHAPGRSDMRAYLRATHTVNLAQGRAFRAMKSLRPTLEIGTAIDVAPAYPESDSAEDRAAAERWHRFQNLWFIEPALRGRYPQGALGAEVMDELLDVRAGDEREMRAAFDFVGMNHYTPMLVRHMPGGTGLPGMDVHAEWGRGPGENPRTDIGWDIYPRGFYDILMRMSREIGALPIEITESGAAFNAVPDDNGRTPDASRIHYLRAYLAELHRAMRDGVSVRAFHHWTLMDNFEWSEGYTQRFGLTHCDRADPGRRSIKDSGAWFARLAASNHLD